MKKSTVKCPDCGSHCRITSTKNLTATVKESYATCANEACQGQYVFSTEPTRCVLPSLNPNKLVNLPMSKRALSTLGINQEPMKS